MNGYLSIKRSKRKRKDLLSIAVVATLNYEIYIYIYIHRRPTSFTKQQILVVDEELDVNLAIKLALSSKTLSLA
ncbi:MAG TPA: hypothetical protein VFY64_07745 [Nitrososphaeraceae archaeon]|nr:hypothetical protein [Nitrososphaeraceae archaeon]